MAAWLEPGHVAWWIDGAKDPTHGFENKMRSTGKSLAHLRSKPLPLTGLLGDDVARERPLEAVQSLAENTL